MKKQELIAYNDVQSYVDAVRDSWRANLKQASTKREKKQRWEVFAYGLAGEVASLLTELKKVVLHSHGNTQKGRNNPVVKEELGDVLWYLTSLATHYGFQFDTEILGASLRYTKRQFYGSSKTDHSKLNGDEQRFCQQIHASDKNLFFATFSEYQSVAKLTRWKKNSKSFNHAAITSMLNACQQILMTGMDKKTLSKLQLASKVRSDKVKIVRRALGNIAWHIAVIADDQNIDLQEVATSNIAKAFDRNDQTQVTQLYDNDFNPREQFPRQMEITFIQTAEGRAAMYYDGKRLGDPLSDNAHIEDGYRFHDALHLSMVAILGWSPVMRALMKRKRKSDPKKDEVEDGARAIIVDEAVVKLMHEEGSRIAETKYNVTGEAAYHELYRDPKDVSFGLLKGIANLVKGFEVEHSSFAEWERVIVEGYKAYNHLNANGQGTLILDLDSRTIKFKKHVWLNLDGPVIAAGSGHHLKEGKKPTTKYLTNYERTQIRNRMKKRKQGMKMKQIKKRAIQSAKRRVAIKKAVARALYGPNASFDKSRLRFIEIQRSKGNWFVDLSSRERTIAREKGIVSFKVATSETSDHITAHVTAVGDPGKTW